MMLAVIDPGSGYQRIGLEMTGTHWPAVRRQRQLVKDEVSDVLVDVHCVVFESWQRLRAVG